MEYWTALSIGLLGSLHCIGMCGPIAFALPLNRKNEFTVFIGSALYNLGRLFTYFSLGVLFGSIGKGIVLAGFQQALTIGVGLILISSVILPLLKVKKISFPTFSLWLGKLKGEMGSRFGSQSNINLFTIGLLNGLLPCGLIYIAIAGSAAMASPLYGGVFMFVFGLGTLPLMLSISVFGNQLQKKVLSRFRKFIPIFILLIGSLFILRGMGLGIPYVSPQLDTTSATVKCH